MIGKLFGVVDDIERDHAIIRAGHIGYIVYLGTTDLSQLSYGQEVELMITTQVREGEITLYGFTSKAQQQCFHYLTSVQGVGAKAGLAILSASSCEQIILAIIAGDNSLFLRVSGIGPKLATRIISELQHKKELINYFNSTQLERTVRIETKNPTLSKPSFAQPVAATNIDNITDATSALVNLGFSRSEALAAIHKIEERETAPVDHIIKEALTKLGSGR
jgi:Holliday junction DNA helicase RuvA